MEQKYYLKPNKEKPEHKNLFGFDIETYGDSNTFLMGSIVNDKETFIFWDKERMINFILGSKKVRNSIFFATNLGFDFLGLFGESFELLSNFYYVIRGSDFILINYKGNHIKFYDTMNFFKCSVYRLGKILGIGKLEKPKCLGKYVLPNSNDGRILEEYNIQDSKISFEFAKFLQDSFIDIGTNIKSTIASTSMNLFKNKYLNCWIEQPPKEILLKQFYSYYGGRTEAFYRGVITGKKYYYDVNSLYPNEMRKRLYPNPNTLKEGINLLKEGFTLCVCTCPKYLFYPLLPLKIDFKLLFPVGTFTGWYNNNELRKAIELGYKIKPLEGYHFTSRFNPFVDFIDDIYKKRLANKNTPFELIYKLLLTSLYGKFAQRIEQQELYFVNDQKSKDEVNKFIEINNLLIKNGFKPRYKIDTPDNRIIEIDGISVTCPRLYYVVDTEIKKYPKFINPILSSYITSYARLKLYRVFEEILSKGGKVYYCDTDSVITDIKLKIGEDLGELKEELEINNGIIVKPKFYYLEGVFKDKKKEFIKSKGLSGLKSHLDFKNILETQEYHYMKFTKFKESLRRKLPFNKKIDVTKFIDLEDNKRIWLNKFNKEELEISKPVEIN